MTVIMTKMPGGVSQFFNPDTGQITYKCKKDFAFLKIEAIGGIVKFNKKGAKATVTGPFASIEDCEIIKENDVSYEDALKVCLEAQKSGNQEIIANLQNEISDLDKQLTKN